MTTQKQEFPRKEFDSQEHPHADSLCCVNLKATIPVIFNSCDQTPLPYDKSLENLKTEG